MPTVDVVRAKRADVVAQVAAARFAYPGDEHSNWHTVSNYPDAGAGIQIRGGGWMYPDLLVLEEPGHFIEMLAVVALHHEVTKEEARTRWLPLSKAGPLYLYVPAGQTGRANRLCQELGIRLAGLRTWKWTPAFGIDVADAYHGPDPLLTLMTLLPPALRPRAYRPERRVREISVPQIGAPPMAMPAPAAVHAMAVHAAAVHAGPPHLPAPSIYPILVGLGLVLTAFGFVFPSELLGAGLALAIVGVLGWIREDVLDYGGLRGAHAPAAVGQGGPPGGVHLPPPSLSPIVIGLGLVLTAFGFVFPAELLGAGLTLAILGVLGWIREDLHQFEGGH